MGRMRKRVKTSKVTELKATKKMATIKMVKHQIRECEKI